MENIFKYKNIIEKELNIVFTDVITKEKINKHFTNKSKFYVYEIIIYKNNVINVTIINSICWFKKIGDVAIKDIYHNDLKHDFVIKDIKYIKCIFGLAVIYYVKKVNNYSNIKQLYYNIKRIFTKSKNKYINEDFGFNENK